MAFPTTIGEALVRVRPDTTRFQAETQKGVTAALNAPLLRAGLRGNLLGSGIRAAGRGGILGGGILGAAALRFEFQTAAEGSEELEGAMADAGKEADILNARIASALTPSLIGLTTAAGALLTGLNVVAGGIERVKAEVDDLPGVGNAIKALIPALGVVDLAKAGAELAGEDVAEAFISGLAGKTASEGKSRLGPAAGILSQNVLEALKLSAERVDLRTEGGVAASRYVDAVTRTLLQGKVDAANATRETFQEVAKAGRDAVTEAIRQGNEAVRLAAINARSNLVSIGQGLAADALTLLEEGPLARRIDALQASLDRSQTGTQRRQLRENLRDAEFALRQAEQQIQTAGAPTAAQASGRQRFLEPFRRDIKDAKAALGEFQTEGVIERLERQAEEQRQTVSEGIGNLVSQFNTGGLTLNNLNVRLAGLLKKEGLVPFGKAGTALGERFRRDFDAAVAQASEILKGPAVPDAALGPEVVSPTGVRAGANATVASTRAESDRLTRASQAQLRSAQNDLKDAVRDNTASIENLPTQLQAAVRAALRPAAKRPTAASVPQPRSGR